MAVLARLVGKGAGGVLSLREVAAACGASRSAVGRWRDRGVVPEDPEVRERLVGLVREFLREDAAVELASCYAVLDAGNVAAKTHRDLATGAATRDDFGTRLQPWQWELYESVRLNEAGVVPTIHQLVVAGGGVEAEMTRRWRFASVHTGGDLPAYVCRSVDGHLRDRIDRATQASSAQERVILVAGDPKAGKTRTVVEALAAHPVTRAAVLHEIPRPTQIRDTLSDYTAKLQVAFGSSPDRAEFHPLVIFVDDLHEHFRGPHGATRGTSVRMLLTTLAGLHTYTPAASTKKDKASVELGPVVVATVHPFLLRDPNPMVFGLTPEDQNWLVDHSINLDSELDPDELDEATRTLQVPDDTDLVRLGETLAGVDTLLRNIGTVRADTTVDARAKQALIDALCDAALFHPHGITADDLHTYTTLNWQTHNPTQPLLPARYDTALEWATQPIGTTTSTWATATHHPTTNTYQLLDALHPQLLTNHKPTPSVTNTTTPDHWFNAGILLDDLGSPENAERWYVRAAKGGNPHAMFNLGWLFEMKGELEKAEQWYLQAARAGSTRAMVDLGLLLKMRGESDEAGEWYQRAAEAGDPDAMNLLGVHHHERGEIAKAHELWRRAEEAGNCTAGSNLRRDLRDLESQRSLQEAMRCLSEVRELAGQAETRAAGERALDMFRGPFVMDEIDHAIVSTLDELALNWAIVHAWDPFIGRRRAVFSEPWEGGSVAANALMSALERIADSGPRELARQAESRLRLCRREFPTCEVLTTEPGHSARPETNGP